MLVSNAWPMADTTNSITGSPGNRMADLPSTPDKRPGSKCFDTIVRIKVGKGDAQEVFEVYKGLLKFYSGYFRAAIDNMEAGRFLQSEENTITLPDEDPSLFERFKSWLFIREFNLDSTSCSQLLTLWCFGDRRQIPLLQNHVIDVLYKQMVDLHYQPRAHYSLIYENTCEGSPLRKFLIYSHARRYDRAGSAFKETEMWTYEILLDLGKELISRPAKMSREAFAKIDMCEFHVHEENVRCQKEG